MKHRYFTIWPTNRVSIVSRKIGKKPVSPDGTCVRVCVVCLQAVPVHFTLMRS